MKNLEKEIEKIVSNATIVSHAGMPIIGKDMKKQLLTFIRQREKELLVRVRDEVIGEFEGSADMEADMGLVADALKREQLKKLEIISEENKE